LTCFDASQHSFQLFDADCDSSLGFLLHNFVCFLSFVFVVQFVVVVGRARLLHMQLGISDCNNMDTI